MIFEITDIFSVVILRMRFEPRPGPLPVQRDQGRVDVTGTISLAAIDLVEYLVGEQAVPLVDACCGRIFRSQPKERNSRCRKQMVLPLIAFRGVRPIVHSAVELKCGNRIAFQGSNQNGI